MLDTGSLSHRGNNSNVSTCGKKVTQCTDQGPRREGYSSALSTAVSPASQLCLAHSGLSINICWMNEYPMFLDSCDPFSLLCSKFARGINTKQFSFFLMRKAILQVQCDKGQLSGAWRMWPSKGPVTSMSSKHRNPTLPLLSVWKPEIQIYVWNLPIFN